MQVRGGGTRGRHLPVNGRQVAGFLLGATAVLLTAGLVATVVELDGGPSWLVALGGMFDLDGEGNLPSWFASSALLACAALLHLLGRDARERGEPHAWGWSGLGWLFVALSADESAQLHERVAGAVSGLLSLPGSSSISWTFLGCGLVLGLLLVFGDFFASLPHDLRRRFMLAGALYAGGSLVLDAPAAGVARIALEEGFELLALVVFLHALLGHVAVRAPEHTVRFVGPQRPRNTAAPVEPPTERSIRRAAA